MTHPAARALLVLGAACAVAAQAAAQGSDPLRKTDVVRLLSSPLIGKSEIADLIRRNCLAFRPTERDWADFRNLGADAAVLGSVGECTELSESSEPAPNAALTVAPKAGATSPSAPHGPVIVRPAAPAIAVVQPSRVSLDSAGIEPTHVAVVVKDALGNPVPGEPVELRAIDPEMGLAAYTTRTDSRGRAAFVLETQTIRCAGRVDVRVRGNRLASLNVLFTVPASTAESRFVAGAEQVGIARTQVNAPLVFQARAASGRPLAGRVISFAAQNAEVVPDRVITDGAGLAEVQVTLGGKAGAATVTASGDSMRKQTTFHVQPAAPALVIIKHDSVRVDGGHLVVAAGTPFALSISAQDVYGNAVPSTSLARLLERTRALLDARSSLLRMESVQSNQRGANVTFRPLRRGTAPLRILDATVSVEVVGRGRLGR
jgi:hypothetical protein